MKKPSGPNAATIQLRTNLAAMLVYLGYRLLGATKTHAWERARVDVATAILDKVVEMSGVIDPRNKDKAGIQAFFEGGPLDGTTRFVDECGAVAVPNKDVPTDARQHLYRRTERLRVQQTVFEYKGLGVQPALAQDLDKAA
jgi:hypothetical protein